MTLNTYNSKNDEIQKQTTMTSVAREIKGDSLVLGLAQFKKKCDGLQVKKYPYSFMIGFYSTDVDLTQVVEDFAKASSQGASYVNTDLSFMLKQPTAPGSQEAYFCNYSAIGGKSFSTAKKNYLVRFYPIALQYPVSYGATTQYLIVPALMAMVFWE